MDKKMYMKLVRIIVSFFLVIIAILLNVGNELVNNILYIISYIIVAYDVIFKAIRNMKIFL